jgi:hypothetical protein
MPDSSTKIAAGAISFVEAVALPNELEIAGALGEEPPAIEPPDFKAATDQTITIGSQLAGFSASVAADIRPHIANAFLLAQLAANKHLADQRGKSKEWYDSYINVLSNIGWAIEGDATARREVKGTALHVHKEIIPIIAAALGPAAAAASTVIGVLNGLAAMNKETPWITLFSRESQRASANQFQVSYATVEGGAPRITLIGFELNAQHSVTQVLFFKFGTSQATLSHFETKISVDEEVFGKVQDALAGRIASFAADFIARVDI